MARSFAKILSEIRHEKGISQRRAAADLKISQALLSHYENGAREPGLHFVCRACDYYGVTADYLLGRSETPESPMLTDALSAAATLQNALRERDNAEMDAAVGKYMNAVSHRLCSEIYGIAEPRELSRLSLEMAEAEHTIIELFPLHRPTDKNPKDDG